jgi:DNA integrity scanning protein DisA with diadenylate cyclase activity
VVPWIRKLKEKVEYLGVNGSATYACEFHDVFILAEWVLTENTARFVEEIRPAFVSYQIPLGLGVAQASITFIEKVYQKQNGCNRFLKKQSDELQEAERQLQESLQMLLQNEILNCKEIARVMSRK